jgi:uncharacterized protein YukE
MFRVEPAALRAAAVQYAAHADQLDVTDKYHDRYSHFDWTNAGLVQQLNGAHHDIAELLAARLRQAADLLRESATGLRRAAEAYERTDRQAAARLDALVPSPWPIPAPVP